MFDKWSRNIKKKINSKYGPDSKKENRMYGIRWFLDSLPTCEHIAQIPSKYVEAQMKKDIYEI